MAAIDFFADRDLEAIASVERMDDFAAAVDLARRFPPSPWLYCGGMENHPDVVAAIAAERPLWGCSAETLRRVREPEFFAAACARVGLPCPSMRPALSTEDKTVDWLRKKTHSCGGLNVEPATDRAAREGWYFQRRIIGESASAAFVSAGERAVLLGVTGQLIGSAFHAPRPFQYAGSYAPFDLAPEALAAIRTLGRELTRSCGLVGLWGLDFIIAAGCLLPLEVNPRYCASFEILEARHRRSFVALHAAAFTQGALPEEVGTDASEGFSGKGIVYATQPTSAADVTWGEDVADLPADGTSFQPGDPVVTVFARGNSREQFLAELARRRMQALAALTPTAS